MILHFPQMADMQSNNLLRGFRALFYVSRSYIPNAVRALKVCQSVYAILPSNQWTGANFISGLCAFCKLSENFVLVVHLNTLKLIFYSFLLKFSKINTDDVFRLEPFKNKGLLISQSPTQASSHCAKWIRVRTLFETANLTAGGSLKPSCQGTENECSSNNR